MDLHFTPGQIALRDAVRAFVKAEYPATLLAKSRNGEEITRDEHMEWMGILARRGWLASSWPKEFGGTGWDDAERYIFKEELGRTGTIVPFSMGIAMCGPVIMKFGTEEQKTRFLPPMARAESWWCQGYSEPGAGSDLAGLRTRAERFKGDDGRHYYRVNGQKTWTTYAQHADWGFFLVRTDPDAKPQRGISFLLIDMASPGITVRPIETLGGAHEVNEVWLDDVIVPEENRVHAENEGWTCAKYLLEHERSNIAEVARSKHQLAEIVRRAAIGLAPAEAASVHADALRFEIGLAALEFTELRALSDIGAGRAPVR